MLDTLRDFIRERFGRRDEAPDQTPTPAPDPMQLAAAALLVQLAWSDGEYSESERSHIEDALARHFRLDPPAIHGLLELADAERRRAIDEFQFTRTINQHFDLGQKLLLAEIMWGVVLADGRTDDHETHLVRKIARLLDLEPGYLSQARRNASKD